jgi:hypothetical protein
LFVKPSLFAALLIAIPSALASRGVRADTAPRGTTRILLVVAAEPQETGEFEKVAAELRGRLSVTVRVVRVERIDLQEIARPAPATPVYLARIFVDLREPKRATLWFVDSSHDRILVRQLERASGADELVREELGHILETSTEGLLAGAEIGLPRAEVVPILQKTPKTETPPPAPARAPAAARSAWQAALLYEMEGLSSQAPITQGPELSFFVRGPGRSAPFGVWLAGQYRLPIDVEASPVGARLEGGAVRALVTVDLPLHVGMTLRFGLGGGMDLVRLTPQASPGATAVLSGGRTLAFGLARAAAGIEFSVTSWLSLWSRVAADFDPSNTSYVFAGRDAEQLVLRPWPVRPAVALGAGFP